MTHLMGLNITQEGREMVAHIGNEDEKVGREIIVPQPRHKVYQYDIDSGRGD